MDDLIRIGKTEEGKLVVTSRQVAEDFGKRHGDLLEKISGLIKGIEPTENSVRYFIPSFYVDAKGEKRKEFLLTRDGFSLLVMGLTGSKALKWKLKYIDAFNRMEEEVLKLNNVITSLQDIITSQQEQIGELTNNVKRIEECVGIRSKTVFDYTSYIKRKLGISKVDNDYNNIKQCIFYEFHVKRWEQLTYNDEVMNRIDAICERVSHRKERKLF